MKMEDLRQQIPTRDPDAMSNPNPPLPQREPDTFDDIFAVPSPSAEWPRIWPRIFPGL